MKHLFKQFVHDIKVYEDDHDETEST